MKKSLVITIAIILAIILFVFYLKTRPIQETSEEIAKCIGERATLYIQLGCHYCKIQEELFGENVKYLKIIDCFYESEKCSEITGTPTWIIDGEKYPGLKSIEKLQELTKC